MSLIVYWYNKCMSNNGGIFMKPFISMRLNIDQQMNIDNLQDFIGIFNRNPGSCDEVWFSTYYGYPLKEKHSNMANRLLESAKLLRENNIKVSLQISNTIGHSSLHGTTEVTGFIWDSFVGSNGEISEKCSCPRDKRFLNYILETTGYYSSLIPDYVWIDDDIRMNNHSPVSYGCFCDRCMTDFNSKNDVNYSRNKLVTAINEDVAIRGMFIKFNQESLWGVVKAVCDGILPISQNSTIGIQMTTYPSTTFNGDSFDFIMNKILEYTGKPAAIRPGGGFYDDHKPRNVFKKGLKLSSATQRKTDEVEVSQAEIENIPHTFSGKSVKGTLLESAVYLAFGCTSLSYSAFMSQNEKAAFYEGLLSGLSRWGNFLRDYEKLNRGTKNGGAGIVFSRSHNKKPGTLEMPFDWDGYKGTDIFSMMEFGMALTWQSDNTPVTLLHFSEVDALSDDEIYEIFSKGVILDPWAVKKLNDRGLTELLNMDVEEFDIMDCCDKASNHLLNGEFGGQVWHNYYTMSNRPNPMILHPKNKDIIVLGNFVQRRNNSVVRGISSIIQETSLGGKAAVFSYNPWTNYVNSARRHQIMEALELLSKRTFPIIMKTPAQAVVIPRVDDKNILISAMVINIGLDDIEEPEFYLHTGDRSRFYWVVPECEPVILSCKKTDRGYLVRLPLLKSWDIGYIRAGINI